MVGGGQFPPGRPNSPFQGGSRFNGPNDVFDGLSNLPLPDPATGYYTNSPGGFDYYGPSDEARLSNDNPLYEIEEGAMFGFGDQNDVTINPLFGDELYSDPTVDMGNFLRPRDPRFPTNNPNSNEPPERDDMEIDELVQSWIRSPRSPAAEQGPGRGPGPSPSNVLRSPPPDNNDNNNQQNPNAPPASMNPSTGNTGLIDPSFLQGAMDESPNGNLPSWGGGTGSRTARRFRVVPPSRFSPTQPPVQMNRAYDFPPSPRREVRKFVPPPSNPPAPSNPSRAAASGDSPRSNYKRGRAEGPSSSRRQAAPVPLRRPRLPPMNFAVQNVKDLVAALRSDRSLFKAEVRKDGAREPRVPGDHDRYFAPRKGDIIVHSTPTDDHDQKLVEYFDPQKTLQRMQPGDKLVRVKYDNQRIPDHLMITCKLYVYAPEWVYLGKSFQTIKTA